jgi:inosine-uridine nucleoside N-ribohydrolase
VRLWIDTDIGDHPDDVVALSCAEAHPGVELVGVSTVGGDAERRAVVARALIDAPVVASPSAEDLRHAAPDALLAIGPLTNIAALITAGALPERGVVMGGTMRPTRHRARMQRVETNFGMDPGAAARVVSGWPAATIVPLDVTVAMWVDDGTRDRIVAAEPGVGEVLRPDADFVLHDALALLVLLGEAPVTVERRRLEVSADGELREDAGGVEHPVVTSVDADAAMARILELLGA